MSTVEENATRATDHSHSQLGLAQDSPLRLGTKFMFALITALGGMVLGTGNETGDVAMIVVAFAIIGFVLVDWLKLFAVPSVIAYAAMALTAIVCVADFVQGAEILSRKMVAVAQLLAVAQAILMMQEKTVRLFEQLFVFALLNCVVAAVFNDAFNYAIWFIPLTFAGGLTLAFLAADQTIESTKMSGKSDGDAYGLQRSKPQTRNLAWDNSAAVHSLRSVSLGIPWVSLFLMIPAVVAFAASFFFALPRRIDPKRGSTSKALVGFSDHLQLGQIGRMQMSEERALRVRLTDPETEKPYSTVDGIYLRGLTLEDYDVNREVSEGGGIWSTNRSDAISQSAPLPVRFVPQRATDLNFYDRVHVDIGTESMRTPTIFAVAPFHHIIGSDAISYQPAKWLIERRDNRRVSSGMWYDRTEYRFGTHAFRNGVQTEWLSHRLQATESRPGQESPEPQSVAELDYLDRLLEFPSQSLPSVQAITDQLVSKIQKSKLSPVTIARRLTRHLSMDARYRYSLAGDVENTPGIDPVEQFLTTDPRGHCQYFASALVMMLRSQNIPSRVVVGFHCNEFSELGQYYIVRQSHAHAWVEALIDSKDVPIGETIYGQPQSTQYWLRLDPTPGGGNLEQPTEGGVGQLFDLAQNMWNDNVVEMDSNRQHRILSSAPALAPMTDSYRSWIDSFKTAALRINADEVRGLSGSGLFSQTAAFATIAFCVAMAVVLKWNLPGKMKMRWESRQQRKAATPSIPFYADTLELLEKVGYHRQVGQTPAELAASLATPQLQEPVGLLTQWFYQLRYGKNSNETTVEANEIQSSLKLLRDRIEHHGRH